jgi:hypothetical protein
MENLQKGFQAKGLDAYSQFKMLGVEGLTDENGNPTFNPDTNLPLKSSDEENFAKYDLAEISPRKVSVALDPFERMVPRWRG